MINSNNLLKRIFFIFLNYVCILIWLFQTNVYAVTHDKQPNWINNMFVNKVNSPELYEFIDQYGRPYSASAIFDIIIPLEYQNRSNAEETTRLINSEIQRGATAGYRILRFPQGNYLIDGEQVSRMMNGEEVRGISIPADDIILDLNRSTFWIKPNSSQYYNIINIRGRKNIRIINGTFIGDRSANISYNGSTLSGHIYAGWSKDANGKISNPHEYGIGINIFNSNNVVIKNIRAEYFTGDGVCLSSTDSSNQNKNIKISNSIFVRNRRQGISIISGINTEVTGCEIYETGGKYDEYVPLNPQTGVSLEAYGATNPSAGIDIESEWNESVAGTKIHYNKIYDSTDSYGYIVDGILVASGNSVSIYNNDIEDSHLLVSYGASIQVYNNNITHNDSIETPKYCVSPYIPSTLNENWQFWGNTYNGSPTFNYYKGGNILKSYSNGIVVNP